jgi:hypothetical protein
LKLSLPLGCVPLTGWPWCHRGGVLPCGERGGAVLGSKRCTGSREVIETIVTPTRFITIMNLSGTHTGEFLGHAPTCKRFTARNVQVLGFRDGKASDR